uniref:Uncharacterized protein n=1 Tax=Lutzomyia longipalpis TaxID=7200 RepID=A0A1B0GIQ1_LUTLO
MRMQSAVRGTEAAGVLEVCTFNVRHGTVAVEVQVFRNMERFPRSGDISSSIPFSVEELDEEHSVQERVPLNANPESAFESALGNNAAEDDTFDLDELLPSISEFGKYQKLLVFLICLPACIPCGFGAFNQLFMADSPTDYWCTVPQLENITNISAIDRRNLAIPTNEGFSNPQNTSWPIEKCIDGWEFNTTDSRSSIVIDVI